jgi:hypothetical protein
MKCGSPMQVSAIGREAGPSRAASLPRSNGARANSIRASSATNPLSARALRACAGNSQDCKPACGRRGRYPSAFHRPRHCADRRSVASDIPASRASKRIFLAGFGPFESSDLRKSLASRNTWPLPLNGSFEGEGSFEGSGCGSFAARALGVNIHSGRSSGIGGSAGGNSRAKGCGGSVASLRVVAPS